MSRFLKVLVALLAIATFASPAFAADRLSLSGQMEVRGFYNSIDQTVSDSFGDSASEQLDDAWNDQRLRIGGKMSVADDVSVNFRFDVTESAENDSLRAAWGSSGQYTQRRADIQFDMAYLALTKAGYTLKAGELYSGRYTTTGALGDVLGAGFVISRGPLSIYHIKQNENGFWRNFGANTRTAGTVDASVTGAAFNFKGEGFSVTPIIAYNANINDNGRNQFGAGIEADVNLAPINLKAELDYFKGDDDVKPTSNDYKGLQLYVDASTKATDMVTVGGFLVYAQGQDASKNEFQVTKMSGSGFGGWDPMTHSYFSTNFTKWLSAFDPSGLGLGSIGGELYADVKVSDDLSMKFGGGYIVNEKDSVDTTNIDYSAYILNGSLSYKLATNTSLNAGITYLSEETKLTDSGDWLKTENDQVMAATGLYVKF